MVCESHPSSAGCCFTILTATMLYNSDCEHIFFRLEWYYAFSSWPEEIRKDLKTAIKARNRGDAMRSEAAFIR
jgi:hypothetical protein